MTGNGQKVKSKGGKMAKERKSKQLSYKRADVPKSHGTTFQKLLQFAVKQQELIKDRQFNLYPQKDEEALHVLNDYFEADNALFGVISSYTPGRHQEVFAIDGDAKVLKTATIPPTTSTTKAGKKLIREFLEGCLYFLVEGNHVVLSQSQAVGSGTAELYFNKLLEKHKSGMTKDDFVYLKNQLSPEKEKKISGAKSFKFSSAIPLIVHEPPHSAAARLHHKVSPGGKLWEAIKDLFPGLSEDFSLESALVTPSIEATITLKLAKKGKAADKIIDEVATVARNTDDLKFEIVTQNHETITNEDYKLTRTLQVAMEKGKLNEQELFRKMKELLKELISTERVYKKA